MHLVMIGGSDAGISAALRARDLDLSDTPPLGSPWEAVQMGAQAWDREVLPLNT